MGTERVIRHVIVRGRVQGVGFRAFVAYQASQRALEGWVRNRRDGAVEVVFAGPGDVVDDMVRVCGAGPSAARVDMLDQRQGTEAELAMRGAGDAFACLPTV